MRRGQTDGVGKNLMLLPKTNLYNNKKRRNKPPCIKKISTTQTLHVSAAPYLLSLFLRLHQETSWVPEHKAVETSGQDVEGGSFSQFPPFPIDSGMTANLDERRREEKEVSSSCSSSSRHVFFLLLLLLSTGSTADQTSSFLRSQVFFLLLLPLW